MNTSNDHKLLLACTSTYLSHALGSNSKTALQRQGQGFTLNPLHKTVIVPKLSSWGSPFPSSQKCIDLFICRQMHVSPTSAARCGEQELEEQTLI